MTEDWAMSHMGRVGDVKPGWVGPPVPGVEQRLTSEGEILVKIAWHDARLLSMHRN